MYNPSLRREPRFEPATVILPKHKSSLLDWLAETGRLVPRDGEGEERGAILEEEVEISELMDIDDRVYEDEEEEELDLASED